MHHFLFLVSPLRLRDLFENGTSHTEGLEEGHGYLFQIPLTQKEK